MQGLDYETCRRTICPKSASLRIPCSKRPYGVSKRPVTTPPEPDPQRDQTSSRSKNPRLKTPTEPGLQPDPPPTSAISDLPLDSIVPTPGVAGFVDIDPTLLVPGEVHILEPVIP